MKKFLYKVIGLITNFYPFVRGSYRLFQLADRLCSRECNYTFLKSKHILGSKSFPKMYFDLSQNYQRYGFFFTKQWFMDWQKTETGWAINKFLKQGDIFIDIGANIGVYTLLAAKKVTSSGSVFSFEPEPILYSKLKMNVALNQFDHVICINTALSNKSGEFDFFVSDRRTDDGGHSLVYCEGMYQEKIKVIVQTFDEAINRYGITRERIKLIKIDMEGNEINTIDGMRKFLMSGYRPAIICEVRGPASGRMPNTYPIVNEILRGFNYLAFKICGTNGNLHLISSEDTVGQNSQIEDIIFLSRNDYIKFC